MSVSNSRRTTSGNAVDDATISRLVLQRALLKLLGDINSAEKRDAHAAMADGDTRTAITAAGVKLGTVSRSFPKPTAVVDDLAIVAAEHPDVLAPVIPDYLQRKAAQALAETHPDLVVYEPEDTALTALANDALAQWEATGQAPAGWRIARKPGVLTVRPNQAATRIAEQMLTTAVERGELPALPTPATVEVER
ncbi:hypothetical protein C1Y63_04970 [Corynebacterium sp. 13CS0277]|uniref:hypothetical protein n=1 Tax=Corynebacterium sp. 13CS0277 TaxID=2071994 RepID=UPI000D03C248|nr:hypothetical protein [Corynebacterium sp. 13CS0277]PRQ11764.1 hypothetical protein C1Y63_04970 [Corynebacterium sp. 13CS0277]